MKETGKTDNSYRGLRWLALGLVAAAILFILGMKMVGSAPSDGLAVAETVGTAVVPTLVAPPANPTTTGSQGSPTTESYPVAPTAQIEWVLRYHKPAMVLFHRTNCKPCIAMTASVEQVRPDYEAQVVFVDVITNDQANATLVRQAQIRVIPTTVFITPSGDGRAFVGLMAEADLRAELASLAAD